MKLKKTLTALCLATMTLSVLTACENKNDIPSAKEISNTMPNNLKLYGKGIDTLKINNTVYTNLQGLAESDGMKKSQSYSITHYMYRLLLNDVYGKDKPNEDIVKAMNTNLKYQPKAIKKKPEVFKEYYLNKLYTQELLQDYFKKDIENEKSIPTYTVAIDTYAESSPDKEVRKKEIMNRFKENLSANEYKKKYPNKGLIINADLSSESKLELLVKLNEINEKNPIKEGQILEFKEPSHLYNSDLRKTKQEYISVVHIIKKDETTIDNKNKIYFSYYLGEKKFGDSEQKYYELIHYLDEKSKNYDLPQFVYEFLGKETLDMPNRLSPRLYVDDSIYSDIYNNILSNNSKN